MIKSVIYLLLIFAVILLLQDIVVSYTSVYTRTPSRKAGVFLYQKENMSYPTPVPTPTYPPTYQSTQPTQNMSYATPSYTTPVYQGPMLPGQNTSLFRSSGVEASGGSNPYTYTPQAPAQITQTQTSSGGFDRMNFNQNPGSNYWWDAANGWTPVNNNDQSAEAQARDAAIRAQIEQGYGALRSGYENLIPYYEQEGQRRIGQVGDTYQTILGGLDQAKQAGMDKLGLAKTEVERRQAGSIADLKQNLNQVMRNTGMTLGAMGAGDTSASQVMAPYAYTKMAGQQFGQIGRQANDQFGQIDQKNVDLEQQYGQMYNQTEIEKSNAIEMIRSDIGSQIARIREMIPQVDAQKAQALAGLEQSLLSQAQQQLAQIQAEDRQRKDSLQQWALQRMSQLQDAQLSIRNTANFDPQAITFNALQSVGAMPSYGQSESYYNPNLKRRQELGL